MGAHGGPAAKQVAPALPFHGPEDVQAARAIMAGARKRGGGPLSERTVDAIAETVSLYWAFCDDHGYPDSPDAVKAWFDEMRERYSTATVANRFYLLKSFMVQRARGAGERRMIVDFFTGIQRKQSRPAQAVTEEKYLTIPELQRFLRDIERDGTTRGYLLGLIVRALFWTGARVSELVGIRLVDCQRARGVVKITVHGKGGKDRVVEIPGSLFDEIRKRYRGRVFLFEEGGEPLSRFAVTRRIERAGKGLLGERITAHTLRHTRAMHLKERGLSPDRTGAYLGHANPATTFTYYYHGKPGTEEIGTLEPGILDR